MYSFGYHGSICLEEFALYITVTLENTLPNVEEGRAEAR
jgi:hypothetical protein